MDNTDDVVLKPVEFGDIEVQTNAKSNKNLLVLVEFLQHMMHVAEGCDGVDGIVCKVYDEVEESTGSCHYFSGNL